MNVNFVYVSAGNTIPTPYIAGSIYFVEDEGKLYFAKDGSTIQSYSGESSAQVQPDWNATSGAAAILNKPEIPNVEGLVTEAQVNAIFSFDADAQTLSITTL